MATRSIPLACARTGAAAAVCAAALAAPCRAADDVLVQAFAFAPNQQWTPLKLRWEASDWRVGSRTGPPATAELLRDFLRRLIAVEVGGRCAGWVVETTVYPCAVVLEALPPTGSSSPVLPTLYAAWQPPAGLAAQAQAAAASRQGSNGASPEGALGDMKFVAVRLEARGVDLMQAVRSLTTVFQVRTGANPLRATRFDLDSGEVVLHRDPPEPNGPTPPRLRSL